MVYYYIYRVLKCSVHDNNVVKPLVVQCVPYLICMGSDTDLNIRIKADQQLQEIDKKYPGFIQVCVEKKHY